jgi:hypothetical protein
MIRKANTQDLLQIERKEEKKLSRILLATSIGRKKYFHWLSF